jgi:hypothetical protein
MTGRSILYASFHQAYTAHLWVAIASDILSDSPASSNTNLRPWTAELQQYNIPYGTIEPQLNLSSFSTALQMPTLVVAVSSASQCSRTPSDGLTTKTRCLSSLLTR